MAESYRGLTIQIGGDTTKLTKALHTANQAVSGTQSSLKKLSDALKLDPTSLKASQLQVGAFAEQASNAATRLVTLNDAMQQVGNNVKIFGGSAATVRELAASWGNVNMVASQTRDYYAALTKTIATNYTELSKFHDEAAKVSGVNMAEKLGESFQKMDFDAVIKGVTEINSTFGSSTNNLNGLIKKLDEMRNNYAKLTDEAQGYKDVIADFEENGFEAFTYHDDNGDHTLMRMNTELAEAADEARKSLPVVGAELEKLREQFRATVSEISNFKGVGTVFKFDNDNVNLTSLAQGLKDVVLQEKMSVDEADALMETYIKLKNAFEDAFSDVQTANVVEGFHDLEAEAAKAEAKVASLVEQLIRAAKGDATKGIAGLEEKLKGVSDAGNNASTRLKQSLDIIQNSLKSSGSVDQSQLTNAMRAYSDVVSAASEKVRILEEEISKLKESGISDIVGMSTQGLVGLAQETEQDYREMATAVELYESALNKVNEERLKIKSEDAVGYEENERYKELTQQAEAWNEILSVTRVEAGNAKQAFVDMSKALTLRDKEHELEVAKDSLKEISNINIKPEVDISAVDGLKKALDAISDNTFSADGLSKFREGVEQASKSLSDAESRYKALSEAAKKDPTNSETLRQRTQAFDQVVEATIAHIDSMKAEIEAIPSDRINAAALATGKANENYAKAKQEVDKYKTALIDVNKRIEELTKERNSIKGLDEDGKGKKRIDELNASLDELKQRRDALAAAGDAAFDNLAIADNTRRVQEHMTAVQQDEARLHELGNEARNVGQIDATPKLDEAAFMQVVDRIGQAFRRMGGEMVQASNEIDTAYRDMRKTVQGTEDEFQRLKDFAIEFSQSNFTSADTMLEMQALGGQLGVLTEDLQKFGTITSNLDIATDLDAESVALKLGQISNVLNLDIDGMQGFSDALVRLGNNMPAQESAIMAVAQRFGAVAATASFSGDEVLAWSAAIAATGQRSEAAATAISNTVSGIEQAVANGGSDLEQFAAIARMSSDQFVKSWADSPTETLRAFIEGLKMLKDSDESAVAALENMGITGVRQQQTLLALTQTVDSLDEALVMSRDAWNNVSDQWGSAGDAAVEAGRKSEGFSGQLQILKNNAQNLAASLGDGLIPMMQAASVILETVTDVFNGLPPIVKDIVVVLGGAGMAFSALTPVLNMFGKGIGGAIASMAQSASIGDFVVKVTGLEGVLMGAAEQGVNLISVFSGMAPVLLAAGAALAVFGVAASAIQDYAEHQETLRQATEGLATAMDSSKSSYDTFIAGAQNSKQSVEELKTAIDETIAAQATLAQQISDKWSEIGESEATVDLLVQKISELTSKESLTAAEQNELTAAVETFNNLTGHSVDIIDAQNGKLGNSIGVIKQYADAWKATTENEAAVEDYGEILKQLAADEAELAEINERLENGDVEGGWFVDARDGADATANAFSDLRQRQTELIQAINDGHIALDNAVSSMTSLGNGVRLVEDALAAEGSSLSNFGNLSDAELAFIAAAFEGAGDRSVSAIELVKRALEEFRSGAGDASSIAASLEASSASAVKAAYNSAKSAMDSYYNSVKANLDAQYRAAQRAYNAQYKAAQKAFDRQYKALQKSYDKEYKALQKKLDKEYKARKKAYDDQLKALKKSQEAEVDAFKDATDAKLKEMEREYKQRLKLLEEEYGGKTGDIDERIAQLKAETEAEKRAIEEREEADKVAELEKAVQQAKSRRKRAEAEKALNDYLQELQAKHHENEREAEISQLEEQKDLLNDELEARKEALKEEYDAEVEAYKTMREQQLEALKDANEAEYEARKEAYDNQLESLKESQTERLEALKESQQASLEALKESQQAQLEAMKESQQAALENMKAAHQKQLEDLKASQQKRLEAIKNGEKQQADEEKKSGDTRVREQDKRLALMERRMQDMGDKNIRTTRSSGDDMNRQTKLQLTDMDRMYGHYGEAAPRSLSTGLDRGQPSVSRSVQALKSTSTGWTTGMGNTLYSSGWNAGINFANGLSATVRWVSSAASSIAQTVYAWLHHSVPEKGPLRDDDEWGADLVQNLIDGMREHERDLARQAEKMARIVEDGFDPTLTVDAAYEALSTIGKNRSAALGSVVEKSTTPSITIEMNMNLSGVTIREDADIERLAEQLSQRMAAQAARQLAGRLG